MHTPCTPKAAETFLQSRLSPLVLILKRISIQISAENFNSRCLNYVYSKQTMKDERSKKITCLKLHVSASNHFMLFQLLENIYQITQQEKNKEWYLPKLSLLCLLKHGTAQQPGLFREHPRSQL